MAIRSKIARNCQRDVHRFYMEVLPRLGPVPFGWSPLLFIRRFVVLHSIFQMPSLSWCRICGEGATFTASKSTDKGASLRAEQDIRDPRLSSKCCCIVQKGGRWSSRNIWGATCSSESNVTCLLESKDKIVWPRSSCGLASFEWRHFVQIVRGSNCADLFAAGREKIPFSFCSNCAGFKNKPIQLTPRNRGPIDLN